MVRIVPDKDHTKIFSENKVVGYVENDILYGYDREGYAVEIGPIDHQNQIETKWKTWRNQQT